MRAHIKRGDMQVRQMELLGKELRDIESRMIQLKGGRVLTIFSFLVENRYPRRRWR